MKNNFEERWIEKNECIILFLDNKHVLYSKVVVVLHLSNIFNNFIEVCFNFIFKDCILTHGHIQQLTSFYGTFLHISCLKHHNTFHCLAK